MTDLDRRLRRLERKLGLVGNDVDRHRLRWLAIEHRNPLFAPFTSPAAVDKFVEELIAESRACLGSGWKAETAMTSMEAIIVLLGRQTADDIAEMVARAERGEEP